jgi:Ca2+-transporting ATPase
MIINNFTINGLTNKQVAESIKKNGINQLVYKKENSIVIAIKSLVKEPMIILLLVASLIYFLSGKTGDGIFLSSAIILIAVISLYQDSRSRNALEKLKDFTLPFCKVIRNNTIEKIKSDDLVIDDILIIEEGALISADGIILHSNDFSLNESILTGESLAVFKDKSQEDHFVFRGTSAASGSAIVQINAIGNETKLGKIGKSLESINEEKTPLEIQIDSFVKKMVIIGAIIFAIVWVINYLQSFNLFDSLLKALTLAMSVLPEEIPVAFTTFMALGAWRLMKMGIVVKQMKTVETLGSATVICVDKTGTITENKMSLAKLFVLKTNKILDPECELDLDEKELIRLAMFASETIAFDPMEIALHKAYDQNLKNDERKEFKLIHEYPLDGKPPMMTHIFKDESGKVIIAAKGAPEALIDISNLSEIEKKQIHEAIKTITNDGYRVLGVGESVFKGNQYPKTQQELQFQFKGIVAFYDPPKKNINEVFNNFYSAGITVKIITGDNAATTKAIAKQVGFKGFEKSISGDELMSLSESELKKRVFDTHIFTRMFPDAKLKIINALKSNNEIVAMTGDGVNDGPALKAAHIGIAMGKKGSEIAKQAASLILVNDNLEQMVDAVAMGRKIYSNLKKAIQYIISIHIPIILTVFVPLALGWIYPNIFSPIHVIFLEIIMGPTCSIIYENEPMEKNTMIQKPRPFTTTFFNRHELAISVIQGIAITIGTLSVYEYSIYNDYNENLTRSMVFTTLIFSNIFLTLVNRSFYYSIITTINYKNNLVLLIIAITIMILGLLIYIKPFAHFFELESLTVFQFFVSISFGFLFVIWYEIVKFFSRKNHKSIKL